MSESPTTNPMQEHSASNGSPVPQPRNRWASQAGIAIVSLVLGIGGTWLIMGRISSGPTPMASGMHGSHGKNEGMPISGTHRVQISPERQQVIGVRTSIIAPQDLVLTIRTVGVLALDQTKVVEIHTRIRGWVERLYVNYEGKSVRRGQPLLSLYSPELLDSQVDYLLGVQFGRNAGPTTGKLGLAGSLEEAARQRLRLRDISEAQIAQLKRTGKPSRTLILYSPADGILVERKTYIGQYLSPELTAFKIADLSTIWVIAQIFESDVRGVEVGQFAEVLFPYDPSARPIKSKITFISPQVDPLTRRISVRLEIKNPGRIFKPDTYVTLMIRTVLGRELAIPKEAVIDTGTRQYTLIALPGGYFEPRTIQVGPTVDEYYPVLGGVKNGDRIVTSAQFLVDSETNLQAAMQAMSMSMPGMKGMDEAGRESMKAMPVEKEEATKNAAMGNQKEKPMPGMDAGQSGMGGSGGPMPAHEHSR